MRSTLAAALGIALLAAPPQAPAAIDAAFAKYAESGAYHWREIGPGLISHNAFTAERYRQVIDRAATRAGDRVLDYGCGDGALLGVLHRSPGRKGDQELHGVECDHGAVRLAGRILK